MIRCYATVLGVLASLGMFCGCGGPSAPPRPKVDPGSAAQAAMAQYDTNKDGKIDAKELEQSPPLVALLATVKQQDPTHGDLLTEEDIARRITAWVKDETTLMDGSTPVTFDGQPLEGATVTLEPESFLGPAYQQTYSGVTDKNGIAAVKGPLEKFPGIYFGLYRVRISKKVDGKEIIPEKYNEKTILGKEMARDAARERREFLRFDLSSQ